MPVPFKVRAPWPATPVVSPVREPRVRPAPDLRTPAVRTPGSAMEPGPSAVVRARAVVGNAAVTAAMSGSPPGAGPGPSGWAGQMMLAGQDLIGNQAVAAQAGAPPTARQPTSAQQQPPAQQQPARKPEPGKKPARKAKAPPGPRPGRKDKKGTEGTRKKEAATPRPPGVVGGGVAGRQVEGASLAGPRRLSLPSFGRRFDVPATLRPMRAGTADREALAGATRAFARLVDRARHAHDTQRSLLERIGRTALDRHDRVESRTRSRVADAETELDDLRLQALGTVDIAYEEGLIGLDLALKRGRGLVASASSGALGRIRANADTAEAQITAIVNDLASSYTNVLEQSIGEITTAATQAIAAVQEFGASASTLFPGRATPLAEAQNEARRKAVPGLAKAAAASLTDALGTQSTVHQDQITVVHDQFSASELANALRTRKSEIDTKGRAAVERATRTAYDALRKQAASGREALGRLAGDARESIELRHKAARARLINEANGLLHASHARADAELTGLKTAATTGLPAFGRMITAVRDGLERAAAVSEDSLRRSAEQAAEDSGPRVDQLGVAQQRLVARADASTGRSVDDAERTAIRVSGQARVAAVHALSETGKASARGIGEFVGGHDASFAATARGVRQVADAWAMPLAQVFGEAVSSTKEAMTGTFNTWKEPTDTNRTNAVAAFTPYRTPATALAADLNAVATELAKKLESRKSEVIGAFIHEWGTDEARLSAALRGMTPRQGSALTWIWARDFHGASLDVALQNELSGRELESARAYLRGDQVAGATAELAASTGLFGDDEERIESTMRNLTPGELSQLKGSKEGAEALADVRDNLGGTDLAVFDALAAGNQDLADAFRMKDELDEARDSADLDAIHDVLIKYGKEPTERGRAPATADERRVAVQQELAGIISDTAGTVTAAISPQQAAATVEKYALAPIEVVVAGPEGTTQVETRDITGANRDLAVALIHGGENTVAARAARLGVETRRAGGPNMLKLDAALVDPRLKSDANVSDEEREKARLQREQVFQKYAADYGGAGQAGSPASAKAYLEGQLRGAFGDDKAAGDLAVRLAHEQYPTPETAALAVRYATDRAGTDEELLFRFVERMDRDEIAAMRVEYRNLTGTALDDDLGTFDGEGMFTELSGDERLRMEVALLGVPRNDREAAEVAAFRMQQQRDETGWLGAGLAGGGLADESLASAQSRLNATLGGATVRVDDHGNPVWTDAAGRPIAPGGTAFDENGRFAGKDPEEFAVAVHVSKLAAENYAAQIDSFASYLTTAVMVIGAVAAAVATVATGGAASPLLIASIAGLTGLGSMAVHSAVSGGRYGWEQAAVDLGMTAVQALTAGVGQQLSIVARGGTQSLTAGMTTLRPAQNLGNTMGRITGSALGDQLAIGAATGGMGGLGGALLDENTWSKGFGAGFAALLEATLTGALAGAASTATSHAVESMPVGRAVAGGPRPTISDALSGSLAARAALRGTSSFIGGATGRGVELGVGAATGGFHGDAGDILQEMGKAGLQSAVEESAAGPVEKPGTRTRQAQDRHDSTTGAAPDSSSGEPVRVGATAADPRLRGDVFPPTSLSESRLRHEVRDAVVRLVGDTSERLFHGRVVRLTDPVTVALTGQEGTPIQVEISLVRGMSESDGTTPAARYTPGDLVDGVRRFTVEVSAGADPRHVEHALARELTEIQSIDKKPTDHPDTQDEQDTNKAVETFLLLSDEYSREKGGVVVFNRSLAEALADAGQNVVVRIGENPAPYAHEQRPNLRIIGPRGTPKGAKPRDLISAKDDPATMPKKVDYVVGHTRFSGPDARATRDARYPDAKLIHFVHMVPDALGRVQEATNTGKALEGMRHHETERGLVAGSDLAVGVGPAITENAEKMIEQARQLGQDVITQKVLELIPGMEFRDRAPHSIKGRPMNVYISGRADAGEKGATEAAQLVRLLRDVARVPARLIVRGVPEHLAERQQIMLNHIAGDAEVRPFTKDPADLRADLDEADVMVMTSRAEGFGLTAHEAAASGVPTMVPSTSGFGRWLGEPGRFREDLTGPSIVEQGYEDPVPIDRWFEALRNVAEHYPKAQQRALDLQQQFKDKKITWETAVGSLIDEARRLR
jgi:hypothetical protein